MEQHDLIQGSDAWHDYRRTHFNASDAPAMMGCSPYKTRQQLLREMATGIAPEVDEATQRRFDDGHRFEELARPLAEKIIGRKLYRVTGSEGKYSASFDGLTADDSIAWEHKYINDDIRAADLEFGLLNATALPLMYRVQMEQQLMVAGANKCLFMASKWTESGELVEERHGWYMADHALRNRILAGWVQFERDLADYQHVEIAEKPKAEAIIDLPALAVQASGMVTYSNLPEFKAAAEKYIASINTDLQTDNDFANAEATVKFCKKTEETLDVTKKAILAQTASIDEVIRTVEHIQAQLRDKRLMLDKLVKTEKEARKLAMVNEVRAKYDAHMLALQREIPGITLALLIKPCDFGGAIKGLKSLASMHDALATSLANAKIEADAVANDVRAKLAIYATDGRGYEFLFADLQTLITKPQDDFTLVINSRIAQHKAAESLRKEQQLEAERQRIEAEAKAKAEREAAEKLAEETARIRAEEEAKARAKVDAEAKAAEDQRGKPPVGKSEQAITALQDQVAERQSTPPTRPSDNEVIAALQIAFGISYGDACDLIITVADNLRVAA